MGLVFVQNRKNPPQRCAPESWREVTLVRGAGVSTSAHALQDGAADSTDGGSCGEAVEGKVSVNGLRQQRVVRRRWAQGRDDARKA